MFRNAGRASVDRIRAAAELERLVRSRRFGKFWETHGTRSVALADLDQEIAELAIAR